MCVCVSVQKVFFLSETEVGAHLDVAMYGFWEGRFEKAFLDVRVFNPSAQSNRHGTLAAVYGRHELEKKRQYEQRVRDVEPLMYLTGYIHTTRNVNNGWNGQGSITFYKRLMSMLSVKRDVSYGKTMNWIRCRLSFALLRASIMSIMHLSMLYSPTPPPGGGEAKQGI